MPEPKGKLVTPVGFQAGGSTPIALLTDSEGRLEVITAMQTTAKARAYLSTAQENIPNDTPTKVNLDAVSYDPSSMFSGGTFTVKVAGYYMITASVGWKNVIADKQYQIRIYKNGVLDSIGVIHAALAAGQDSTVSDIKHLNVDDYLELYCYQATGADTVDLVPSTMETYLALHLLSAD